jgi:RHS repeat-associated protein
LPTGNWQVHEYDEAGRLVYVRDDAGWIEQANEYASSRERLASWSYASADITYYAWGGSSVLAEYTTQYASSTLTWDKSYIYAGSRLLSTFTKSGSTEVTEYHHPDRLGTRMITNPSGASQVEQLTLPFGTSIDAETNGTSNQRFTSYDRSDSTGLDYAVNRTYNPGQSRFTQVDPIGMASASIGDPQSLNLFAYVTNNPIDFVDPSGLDNEWIVDVPIDFGDDDDWGGGGGRGGGYSDTPFPEDPGDDHNNGAEPGEGVGSPLKGEKEKSPPSNKPTPCDVLASDSEFRKWAKELWKNAIKPPDGSYKRETGGLWGHIIDTGQNWEKYEPKVKATYDRKSTAKSLPEFNGWMRDTLADPNYKNVNWLYWVHTHPVSGGTKPSGVGGDLSVSNLWKLPALIIGKNGRFSIYDRKNKWVCDGSIGKVK